MTLVPKGNGRGRWERKGKWKRGEERKGGEESKGKGEEGESIDQGCPLLYLEGHNSADFRSNPN